MSRLFVFPYYMLLIICLGGFIYLLCFCFWLFWLIQRTTNPTYPTPQQLIRRPNNSSDAPQFIQLIQHPQQPIPNNPFSINK